MTVRTFTKEFLTNELDLPGSAIEDEITSTSRWSEHHSIIFEFQGKFYSTGYSCGATEMQDERPWQDENEIDCMEMKLATVKVEKYVPIGYKEEVEESSSPTSNGLSFLVPPPPSFDAVALWAFYNQAEKEAKKAKEGVAATALKEVKSTQHKFMNTQYGGAQMISKETRKAKDTLKFVLQNAGHYDLCRKDEVDLKKVDELVEAGILDEKEISQHIEKKNSSHLQIKSKKK